MKLIDDIKESLKLEVRISSDAHEYFEAVFQTEDLNVLLGLVKDAVGEPLKPPGKEVKFPKHIQKLVDLIGGIRRAQSFYLKEANGKYVYVALWPWQSDPSRITLKIGRGNFSSL